MWWMLARMAGWDGNIVEETSTLPTVMLNGTKVLLYGTQVAIMN
jgi:hypothetical protein